MPDDTVKLVHGSANLSVNSWEYHTNQISVFTTEAGTELDEEFVAFLDEYRERLVVKRSLMNWLRPSKRWIRLKSGKTGSSTGLGRVTLT